MASLEKQSSLSNTGTDTCREICNAEDLRKAGVGLLIMKCIKEIGEVCECEA